MKYDSPDARAVADGTMSASTRATLTARRNWPLTRTVLVFGLAITAMAASHVKSGVDDLAERAFTFHCNEVHDAITARLDDHARILLSGAALFSASEAVTREEWRIFTKHQKLETQLPGIQGIGFAVLIPRAELPRHIQAIRSEGFPEYSVKPEGDRELYSSIIYLEPFSDRNLRAFGYDMLSEPVRREAMELARNTDKAALSGKVVLVQETDKDVQAGILMYVPVYRKGMPTDTVERRHSALYGWVYSPYRMNDLMLGILGSHNPENKPQRRIEIFDGAQSSPQSLLYTSHPAKSDNLRSSMRFIKQAVAVYNGHVWTLRFAQNGGGIFTAEYTTMWLTMAGGTVITVLLCVIIQVLTNTRANAERLAKELNRDLRESEHSYREQFARNSTVMLLVDPADGAIIDANAAAVDFYGHPRERLLAMCTTDINLLPATEDGLARSSIEKEYGSGLGFQHRMADGSTRDVEVSASSIRFGKRTVLHAIIQDVTDRKRAEDLLRQTTDRLTLAARAGGVGIWDYDVVNNKLVWDDQMFVLYGIARNRFSGAYEAWQAGLHPEDRLRGDEEIQRALRAEVEFDTEFRVVWPDGTIRNIRALAIVQRDGHGRPVRMIGTNWDITAQKRTEKALVESEANFRAFFESVTDMMMVGKTDGRLLFTNTAVARTLGYSAEELAAMHILDLHPLDKRREAEDIFAAMFRGERASCPLPLARKDSRLVPVDTRIWRGRWNGEDCIFGVSKNLTAEQEAQQRFERLFRSNPAPMAISALPDRRFTDINDAFLKVLGYAKGDVIGKTSAELGMFVHQEQQAAIAERLRAEGRVVDCELQFRCKDGAILDSLFSGEVIDSQGQQYFLTVMIDITARTKAEEFVKSVHRRLLGVREEEGRRIAEELHESVCQDLAALRISLMALGHTPEIAAAAGVGSKISTAADICVNIMNDIRHICYAVYPPVLQTLGLVAALRSLEKTGDRLGARVQIHCEVSLEKVRLPQTMEVAMFRVAQEAVVNATRHGKAQSVFVMLKPHDGGLLLRITDDGGGFDIDTVVEGLGLTVMRERMYAIGGTLGIASSPGLTTVTAVVPTYPESDTGITGRRCDGGES